MTAGYSEARLAKKLSKAGQRAWFGGMPESVRHEIGPEAVELALLSTPENPIEAAHIFLAERAARADAIARLPPLLGPRGWPLVSWPKKASKVPTDITEDAIREAALPTGLVDVKVCAVYETWSGLKLMIPQERR